MKIVVLDGYTENPGDLNWDALQALGDVRIYDRTPEKEIIKRIDDAEIVFTNKTPLSQNIFTSCPTIKYIGVLATGYNVVDTTSAKEHNIIVTNIPTYGTDSVAQFAIGLLLELCHHIGSHSDSVHQGDWNKSPDWCYWNYPLIELAGKTIGIIGFGRIGHRTGQIAKAFNTHVIVNDQYENPAFVKEGFTYVEREELFKTSDVIILHCPLFPSTNQFINKESISQMKDGVMIINNSRGQLINENDLADALNSGKVAGAALDVVSTEPIQEDNPLLYAQNTILTPHISWAPKESRLRLMNIAVDNLKSWMDGNPINVVNKE